MKQMVMIGLSLTLTVVTASAMESEVQLQNPKTKEMSVAEFKRRFEENDCAAMKWCTAGMLSALSASKLATICQNLGVLGNHKVMKRSYYFLVVATVVSIYSMLKYARKNKQLLDREYGEKA